MPAPQDLPLASHHVLVLSPFHAGSHRAFLQGWQAVSRHRFTVCELPGRHWKWRMRHSALTLAHRAARQAAEGLVWDCVVATDMLNVPEWLGFAATARPHLAHLPLAVYFHESQFTYPTRDPDQNAAERDLHFAYTNFLSAVAADGVWFNSNFHRETFLNALPELLRRMPDCRHREQVESIRKKALVQYPGISRSHPAAQSRSRRTVPGPRPGREPLRIVWAARWEHDKGPETLFEALRTLREWKVPFRLSVLGESYGRVPDCFSAAHNEFAELIDHWGFVADHGHYLATLSEHDVIVSTAHHEFFGIAILEAAAAGCVPLLPRRLAYPEIFADVPEVFYGQSATDLAAHLRLAAQLRESAALNTDLSGWMALRKRTQDVAARFDWGVRGQALDRAVDALASSDHRAP